MPYSELISQHSLSEMRRLELRTKRNIDSDLIGKYRTAFRGTGLIFSDLRAYEPGDDIRNIHWKVTARTGKPFVKTFEEDRQLNVMLAVDISNSTNTGTVRTKHSKALEFAALITMLSTRSQDAAGLCLFSNTVEEFIAPSNKRSQFQRIMGTLLKKRTLTEATNIAESLKYIARHQRKHSIVFVVSDFYSPPFVDELKMLAFKHDVIGVLLLDDLEDNITNAGLVEFFDAETGQKRLLDTSSSNLKNSLNSFHTKRISDIKRSFQSAGADFIVVKDNLIRPLANLIKLRTRRH